MITTILSDPVRLAILIDILTYDPYGEHRLPVEITTLPNYDTLRKELDAYTDALSLDGIGELLRDIKWHLAHDVRQLRMENDQ
jgi:hypothetical protein